MRASSGETRHSRRTGHPAVTCTRTRWPGQPRTAQAARLENEGADPMRDTVRGCAGRSNSCGRCRGRARAQSRLIRQRPPARAVTVPPTVNGAVVVVRTPGRASAELLAHGPTLTARSGREPTGPGPRADGHAGPGTSNTGTSNTGRCHDAVGPPVHGRAVEDAPSGRVPGLLRRLRLPALSRSSRSSRSSNLDVSASSRARRGRVSGMIASGPASPTGPMTGAVAMPPSANSSTLCRHHGGDERPDRRPGGVEAPASVRRSPRWCTASHRSPA